MTEDEKLLLRNEGEKQHDKRIRLDDVYSMGYQMLCGATRKQVLLQIVIGDIASCVKHKWCY